MQPLLHPLCFPSAKAVRLNSSIQALLGLTVFSAEHKKEHKHIEIIAKSQFLRAKVLQTHWQPPLILFDTVSNSFCQLLRQVFVGMLVGYRALEWSPARSISGTFSH